MESRKVRREPPDQDFVPAVDRLGQVRAGKPPGLADEIAFLRMRLLKSHDEDIEDVRELSLGLERLARIQWADRKLSGKGDPDVVEKVIAYIQAFEDQFGDVPRLRSGEPVFVEAEGERGLGMRDEG